MANGFKLIGEGIHRLIGPTAFGSRVAAVYFISIYQDDAALWCNMVTTRAIKLLGTIFNNSDRVAFVAVARKILAVVVGIKQINTAQLIGNAKGSSLFRRRLFFFFESISFAFSIACCSLSICEYNEVMPHAFVQNCFLISDKNMDN